VHYLAKWRGGIDSGMQDEGLDQERRRLVVRKELSRQITKSPSTATVRITTTIWVPPDRIGRCR
jgi:hypothetical protein